MNPDAELKAGITEFRIYDTGILPKSLRFMERELTFQLEISNLVDHNGVPLVGIISKGMNYSTHLIF